MFLAYRNLVQDKTRLALSILGVALAVMLILLLNGLMTGLYRQLSAYFDNAPGTVVVQGSTPLLPVGTADAARKIDGVASVLPVFAQYIYLDLHEKTQMVLLIGYDPKLGGGPWRLAAGREPQADNEVVLDRVLAQQHGFQIGDKVKALGLDYTLVGLSDGASSWLSSDVFVRKSAVEARMFGVELTTFLLVTPAPGVAPEAVRERLCSLPGVNVLLKDAKIASDQKLFAGVFSAPIRLMVGIAFLVGTLIVGLIIYTASLERQSEYAVLKAAGARNRVLYEVVIAQALMAASIGAAVGVGFAFLAAQLIMTLLPEFLVVLEPIAIVVAFLGGLIMALPAALFPARIVARLAPAEVLRR